MKKIFLIIIPAFFTTVSNGQGVAGFFTQSETKLKDMALQIAAYEVYLGYLKDGYNIAQKGTSAIHDLKNGTYQLHQDYFNSLKSVNPSVSGSPKVKGIIALQQSIESDFDRAIIKQTGTGELTAVEISYIKNVYKNLLAECKKDIDQLTDVITPGKLQMKDDERLRRINSLYAAMQDKYAFTETFISNTTLLSLQSQKETNNLNAAQNIYGLK